MTWGQQQGVGRLPAGWSTHRGSPPPLFGVGCPSAPPWEVAHGGCPHVTAPRHKANWVLWWPRQSVSQLFPPWSGPWPDWDSPIQLTDHNFYPLLLPPLPVPTEKQCHGGVFVPPPNLKAIQEDSFAWEWQGSWNQHSEGQILIFPHMRAISFLQQSTFCRKKAYSAIV